MKEESGPKNKLHLAFLVLTVLLPLRQWSAVIWQNYPIGQVFLLNQKQQSDLSLVPFRPLLRIKGGAVYQYQDIRSSIENLYKTGVFSNIEAKIEIRANKIIDVYFILQNKAKIRSLRFTPLKSFGKRQLQDALYSLHKNDLYEESKMAKAVNELQTLLKAKGYLNAQISPQVSLNDDQDSCAINFIIAYGQIARIRQLSIDVNDDLLVNTINSYFKGTIFYDSTEFNRKIEKTKKLLKQKLYNFPEIKVQEDFLNPQHSLLDIKITINCGYKYIFVFKGMAAKMALIANVWEREVFEKWAEEESRSRLLNYLKNEGYLDAKITSSINTQGIKKTITFTASKNRRYKLGKIAIHGNQALSSAKIIEIINTDNLIFNNIFWLQLNSLLVDMEVLKLFYYYQGISPLDIRLETRFRGNRADIDFFITEGRKYRMENIEFSGNQAFSRPDLYRLIKSKNGTPFVPRQLSEDIDLLQNFYWNNGFAEATVTYELSPGEQKSLLIKINEKRLKKMGELIIIGASNSQKKLLEKRFQLKKGEPFSKEKIDSFRTEIENSAIFPQIKLDKIAKEDDIIDVLVKVIQDRSSFYSFGFGFAWQERSGIREVLGEIAEKLRGTLEFQKKTSSILFSSLNLTLQGGLKEQRGILSIDTPYFFNNKITSSFKIWDENEAYPSYQFNRWGLGMSGVKKFSENLYFLGSVKWYRTELTELKIPPFGMDQVDKPFNTTAFSLSFVNEKRNNPFNPSSGFFLSADLKLGLPLFEKDYTFLKFFWNYQKHYPFLRPFLDDCVFSFSIKNGFALGDMSITERFFAGGSHSFRGTRNDRLGPINLVKDEPEGGNVLFLVNMEVTMPLLLIPIKNLYYTFFADVGNVFAKSSDLNFNKMERALGFGLKYRTGFGPVRIDLAFNLRRRAEKNFLIQIGFGNVY